MLTGARARKATERVVALALEYNPKSRNARLGQLEFLALEAAVSPGQKTLDGLLRACTSYFDDNASKTSCFDDLRAYVEGLDARAQAAFLEHAGDLIDRKHPSSAGADVRYRGLLIGMADLTGPNGEHLGQDQRAEVQVPIAGLGHAGGC